MANLPTQQPNPESTHALRQESRKDTTHAPATRTLCYTPKPTHPKRRCTRAHRNRAIVQHSTLKNTVHTSPLAHALLQEQAARAAKSCPQLPGCAVSCVVWRDKLSHKDQRSHSSDTQREPAQEALQRSAQLQDHTTTTACSCRTGLLLLVAAPTGTSF